MLHKHEIPSHRCINREEYMLRPSHQCGPCFDHVPMANEPIEQKPNVIVNPRRNLRIKFVGFIYNSINYIIDLDNKEVIYKSLKDTHYKRLKGKVSVMVSPITKSYSLNFNLYQECSCAEVEVYPNCIDHCSVTITDIKNHSKEILDDNYVAYEFFKIANMLDKNLNIITMVDYEVVFNLTENELATLFTYNEAISFIKEFIDNIYEEKDVMEVTKGLLHNIKNKLNESVEEEDNETDDDIVIIPGVNDEGDNIIESEDE